MIKLIQKFGVMIYIRDAAILMGISQETLKATIIKENPKWCTVLGEYRKSWYIRTSPFCSWLLWSSGLKEVTEEVADLLIEAYEKAKAKIKSEG